MFHPAEPELWGAGYVGSTGTSAARPHR